MTACSSQRVGHLVFLSIWGVENPVFDGFPYYLAKRAQEGLVAEGEGRPTRGWLLLEEEGVAAT